MGLLPLRIAQVVPLLVAILLPFVPVVLVALPVARVTQKDGPEFVPPAERIATFDNDGTLWSEKPVRFQLLFAFDRVKALAPKHPEWKSKEPFASLLKGDTKGIAASGEKGVLAIMAATHTGMTTDEFSRDVQEWIASARHPKRGSGQRMDSGQHEAGLEDDLSLL